MSTSFQSVTDKIILAFQQDQFEVDPQKDVFQYNEKLGVRAVHKTAIIGKTGKKKKAFYVEGSPYEMGYLLGLAAEPDISAMTNAFVENIIFAFVGVDIQEPLREIIGKLLKEVIYFMSEKVEADLPQTYAQEIQGVLDVCKKSNPNTQVDYQGLLDLNVGIDVLLSIVYTGKLPAEFEIDFEIKPEHFRIPLMCNAFTACGESVENNGHFFGRDFMFPTADVFQDTACMIIQNPDQGTPFVSMTAPGMLGTIAAVNSKGVAVGVDMAPGGNCNPDRPGINSLLLNRLCVQQATDCDGAVNVIVNTQRGVTWDYIVADGKNREACIVEAGMKTDKLDFLSYPPQELKDKKLIPDQAFLDAHPTAPQQQGVMVRKNDFKYPQINYGNFNQGLFTYYMQTHADYTYTYNPEDFGKMGFLNKTWKDKNCPSGFYFAPQRENLNSLVVVSNHFVIPEMRLCSMAGWISLIASANINDIQWRYDELNFQLLTQLKAGPLTYDSAKKTIDFLAPYNQFPAYYNPGGKPLDEVVIEGCVSLMDLQGLTLESHYGYYSDEWVKIRLKNYL